MSTDQRLLTPTPTQSPTTFRILIQAGLRNLSGFEKFSQQKGMFYLGPRQKLSLNEEEEVTVMELEW